MTNLERAKDLYNRIGKGEILEAFDHYYSNLVVMEEPRGKRSGKAACRTSEEQFVASVATFHGMEIRAMAEDENQQKVLIEVTMDLTFKGGPRVTMEQVSVQTWDKGQIVHERFYYDHQA